MSIKDLDGQLQTQVGEDEESKHILLLYDEEESLKNVFGASEELTKENWFRVYCGPASHPSIEFLREHGWADVTLSPYTRLLDDSKQYFNEVWQRITDEAREKRNYAI